MKRIAVLFFLANALAGTAQSDTIKNLRFSGLQFGVNFGSFSAYNGLSIDQYRSIIKDDPFLYEDHTGYDEQNYNGFQLFGGGAIRLFAELPPGKRRGREISIGIIGGGESTANLSYYRKKDTIVDIYYNKAGTDSLLKIREYSSSYYYSISGSRFFLPLGIHFNTNKDRYLWVSAGMEVAPGFAKYSYSSFKSESTADGTVDPQIPQADYYRYYDYRGNYTMDHYSKSLPGIGFAGFVSIPFSANIRFSKTRKVLKNINLYGQIAPVVTFSSSKYFGSQTAFGGTINSGFRIAW